jgi:hypothetical protein
MARVFSRLAERVLAHLGEDALLRGAYCGRVNVEHDVEVAQGNMTISRSVATIMKTAGAAKGDALLHGVDSDGAGGWTGGTAYIVDSPAFADNGYTQRFVLRGA